MTNFVAPGPGCWEIEATHLNRPVTRWMSPLFPPAFMAGFRATTAHYGALLDTLEPAEVAGFIYICARPFGAPKTAKGPPPKWVLKLLCWLHPAFRARNARMAESFATKRWRSDVERWDREWKPAATKRLTALHAVDPAALGDAELAAHLADCRQTVLASIELHHRLNLCNMLPLGDYLVHAAEWTGLTAPQLLAPMRGATPVSLGAAAELTQARAAIAADAEAAATLASAQEPAAIIAALRARPGAVGIAVRAWLDVVGWRIVTGYDVSDRCAAEMPEVLIGALRAASVTATVDPSSSAALVIERAPAERRAELTELLREARDTFRIRDERGYLNDAWGVGLARRALLAAGERLTRAGKLAEASHAVDLGPSEIESLVAGGPGPTRETVAERVAYRTSRTVADAPAHLGYPPSKPPPPEWLPPAAARGARAIGAVMSGMFDIAKEVGGGKRLKGLGASSAVREGIARVVRSPADFARVQQGDVLVARNTAPSYNVLLPLLNGIVTDRGGLLSHAAIVAREYDLAAVVGCGEATTTIPDGARVRVDGAAGVVEVLS